MSTNGNETAPLFTALVVGNERAGKTTLVKTLQGYDALSYMYIPTLGHAVETVDVDGQGRYVLWDHGGQDCLRARWAQLYRRVNAVIYVIGQEELNNLEQVCEVLRCNNDKPVLVLINLHQTNATKKKELDLRGISENLLDSVRIVDSSQQNESDFCLEVVACNLIQHKPTLKAFRSFAKIVEKRLKRKKN